VASSGVWPGETSHRHGVFPPSYLSTVEAHLIGSPDPAVGVVFTGSKNSTNGWKTVATSAGTPHPRMLRLTVQPTSVTRDWTPTAASNSTAAVTRLVKTVGAGQVAAGRSEVARRCTAPSRSASRR